ncbi:hypothetical protein [uncultured virus]|uniref:Uncharacterized protein n=1 Tax=uncultured virus TaxID=340016 RepID=A0A218MKY5_9VIRU|nr:hypothetical protein [uncultured virus]
MVQEETKTAETAKTPSTKKKTEAPKYDAVQESDPSVLTVYKFTSRYGAVDKNGNRKEYKVAAESLRSAARLVGIKADSVTQTGVDAYSS